MSESHLVEQASSSKQESLRALKCGLNTAGRRRSETQHGAPGADVNLASFNVGLKHPLHLTLDKENPPADSRQSNLHRKSVGVAKPCREPSETNRSLPSLVMQTTLVHTRNGPSAKHELGKFDRSVGSIGNAIYSLETSRQLLSILSVAIFSSENVGASGYFSDTPRPPPIPIMIFTILISLPFALIAAISIAGYLVASALIYSCYSVYKQPLYLPLFAAIIYSCYTSPIPAAFLRTYLPSVYKTIH
jgi:hypothetical protein